MDLSAVFGIIFRIESVQDSKMKQDSSIELIICKYFQVKSEKRDLVADNNCAQNIV